VRRPKKRPFGSLVYVLRLLIVGVGIGAIVGSLLSAIDPSTQVAADPNNAAETQVQESPEPTHQTSLPLTQEISALKAQFQALAAENPNLQPGVFVVDLDTGNYLDWQGNAIFAAASTIKVPILLAFFQDVDAGKIRLDEPLILQEGAIAAGAGDLQYQQPGSQYTALEVATKMITISDNTATNMLIARLGGAEVLNQRFRSWGLSATMIRNPLPDVEGTNTTSPKELAQLMAMVDRGELISLRSRDRLLDIMQEIATESLLPDGLGEGATIAHKTGNIGSLVADAGLVDMPTGKRYIITAMVKRPHNDTSAQELIREISRTTYDYFHQPHIAPDSTSRPPDSTAAIAGAFREPSYDLN
jgi:beta-lactamase class A